MKNKSCSLVIRSYNEERHLEKLLTGVLEQSFKEVEIILVDSGSTDRTLEIAARFPVKILTIDPGEFTFGRSLNMGCREASGEFIVISSAHVYPLYHDWLEQLILPFDDPQVALVYGKQRGDSSTKFSEHQVFASWFPEESINPQDHPFCNNANAAIRRSIWQVRGYDQDLSGLEDVEWASWARSQGYALVYSAHAEVVHVHEETYPMIYNRYRREAMALRRIRPEEHFDFVDFLKLFPSNVISDWAQALHEKVFINEFINILRFRFVQFWGTYRGFALPGPLTGSLKRTFYYPRRPVSGDRSVNARAKPIDYGASKKSVEDSGAERGVIK
jgi:rhamnosyltransferase